MTAVHDEEGLEAPVSNLPILTSGSNGHCRLRRRPHQMHEYHVLLGVTGSVATVKVPELAVCLCRELGGFGENGNGNNAVHIKIVLTMGASHFWEQARTYSDYWWKEMQQYVWNTNQASDDDIAKSTMENFGVSSRIEVIHSDEEWRSWRQLGDPVLHIALRDWADLLVIAPLSAHTLAKLAHGLCDDMLTSVARAWDFSSPPPTTTAAAAPPPPTTTTTSGTVVTTTAPMTVTTTDPRPKPFVLAPAMNTSMWDHPLTRQHLNTIQGFFYFPSTDDPSKRPATGGGVAVAGRFHVVPPQTKTLACGQVGTGALAPISAIVETVRQALGVDIPVTTFLEPV